MAIMQTKSKFDYAGALAVRWVGRAMLAMVALLSVATPAQSEVVRVASITLGEVLQKSTYSAPATVVARQAPRITSEISAAVASLPLVVGDQVEPGDMLARLDCGRYEAQRAAARAAVDRAKAQREFAQRQLNRARDLRKKNSISEELLDQRRTELAAADTELLSTQASARLTEIDVDSCSIRSPLKAVITARHANVGDYLVPGSAVVDLTELTGQEVSVALRADQVTSFRKAASWTFTTDQRQIPLQLRTIVPVIDSTTRTREARLAFVAESASPGSPGRISWSSEEVRVPADYLLRRNGKLGILIVDNTTARFVHLPDAEEGRPAATTLPPDTRLITAGRQRLSDGDAIELVAVGEGRE